jgi:hypothetical protein
MSVAVFEGVHNMRKVRVFMLLYGLRGEYPRLYVDSKAIAKVLPSVSLRYLRSRLPCFVRWQYITRKPGSQGYVYRLASRGCEYCDNVIPKDIWDQLADEINQALERFKAIYKAG